jgi:prepilin-type processing-associated H-X9-DG protein
MGSRGGGQAVGSDGLNFQRFSDIRNVSPSEAWCVTEEHETGIHDSHFLNIPRDFGNYDAWLSVPSARHRKGCSLSFVDGHVERHRWLEKSTLVPVNRIGLGGTTPTYGQSRDVQWLTEHATALPDP